ncbi:hypothetical protein K502DRAFT_346087 [Neoconidiobolus thromboides FSU 785]|nr:hypothetical protein K502DRAFT_346087 [Neoconidiobolus thromboides FSU 785]
MNQFLLKTIILAFTATISSLPASSNSYLARRGFNSFYPGYGLGGYGGFNSGFGSFGFPTVISNNAFNANANNFNANEFDRNKEAAVFVDNVHKKDVNSNHSNVNSHNNAAII